MFGPSLILLLVSLTPPITAVTVGPTVDLSVGNADIAPDGLSRSSVLAGGTFPGPVIRGTKGDRFLINVTDNLVDTNQDVVTTIHWHGFFQHGTNWADGVDAVTQCPIIPGNSFLYNFTVPDQAGDYWYHSHYQAQYCDGLRGAFIVDDPADPQAHLYDVDNETTIITLADWYHYFSTQAGDHPNVDVSSTLINGLGRANASSTAPLAVVNVRRNTRYRLRIISMSCDPNFLFSIDKHQLQIIAVDGENVQPHLVDSIQVFAAQRYSVVLNANQPVNNYWIRALRNYENASFTGGQSSAILRYAGAPISEPAPSSQNLGHLLSETELHPLDNPNAPGTPGQGRADINLVLSPTFNFESLEYEVNGVTFLPPSVPVLLQILSGNMPPQSLLPGGSVIQLDLNKTVEIAFPVDNTTVAGPHPIHLHGHSFSVVRSAGQNGYNYQNPVRRDTVSLGATGDNVTIRFETDNPGPWFIHCHIDWHLERGFAVVLAEGVPETSSTVVPPPAWSALCPAYNAFQEQANNVTQG
ncbi:multicopper redoxase [Amylostereum chailletii]|nr:multicopper redoxase [Amylostereum chailletii]